MAAAPHDQRAARVLLADPHERFRAALRLYLHTLPGVRVVAEAATAQDAVAAAEHASPHVALVDLALCLETRLVHSLARIDPRPRLVIASLANEPAYEHRALGLGADAWVAKDDLTRIHAILAGAPGR